MPGTSKVEWMHIFADQESIELSVSQYCKLHGISDKAFYNAKSRYKWATEEPSLVAVEVNDDIGSSNTACIRFEFNVSVPDNTKNHKNMFVVMISFDDIPEIYIVKNVTDLRKEIDGYASIVQDALFVFCNKHICKKRIDPIDNDIVSFQIGSFNLSNKFCVLILDLQDQH